VVILAAFAAVVLNLQPDRGAEAQPAPISTPMATVTTPTASPSPGSTRTRTPTPASTVAAPEGFVDCSSALEQRSGFCVTEHECWSNIISMEDVTSIADLVDCDESHVYQTFAAGQLPAQPVGQSDFEASRQVQRLCSAETLEAVLPAGVGPVRKDWQIVPLPQQTHLKDSLFRCLVSFAEERTYPVEFRIPE
jgi:hypothetical protein